jgi:hypothetical protein
LFSSGFFFMGATEEQMALVANSGMDHVAYILILYSFAALLFLFVNMLIHLYDRNMPGDSSKDAPNGRVRANGTAERQLRDAEEFELEGLMSDDDEETKGLREEDGSESPSTLGKNSDRLAR